MNKTILICDDEKHMQRLLAHTLSRTGCAVEMASSGDEALSRIGRGGIDLLLIDVMMPGKSGLETVRELRATPAGGGLPVVVMTARGAAETREEAGRSGTDHFITKPFSPAHLHELVLRLLAPPGGPAPGTR